MNVGEDHVATVEFDRPPHNHFDVELIAALADTYEALDADPGPRVIVLCSAGRHFCAGANFAGAGDSGVPTLYAHAVRLFAAETPVVAAVQGATIGGGLGLALSADFRVASPVLAFRRELRAPGHPPRLRDHGHAPRGGRSAQASLELLYTGRRVKGEEAYALGLCDRLAAEDELRGEAYALAREIAASAPLAVRAIRQTMRGGAPPIVCEWPPSASTPSRRLYSRPMTFRRAFARAPSVAPRASPVAEAPWRTRGRTRRYSSASLGVAYRASRNASLRLEASVGVVERVAEQLAQPGHAVAHGLRMDRQ